MTRCSLRSTARRPSRRCSDEAELQAKVESTIREYNDARSRVRSIDEKIAEGIKKVEVIVKSGRIRETLKEDMLDVIEPDLIICGARGLSSIKYALLGSISTFLTRNAKCDTLVLK